MLHGSRTLTINNRTSNLACRFLLTVRGKLEIYRLLIRRERSPHLREAAVASHARCCEDARCRWPSRCAQSYNDSIPPRNGLQQETAPYAIAT